MRGSFADALTARRAGLPGDFSASQIPDMQCAKLRQIIAFAREKSPWYARTLNHILPENIRSLADLDRVPFLQNADLSQHGAELLCLSRQHIARVMTLQTSGSTGPAKRLFFSHEDLRVTREFFAQGMGAIAGKKGRVLVLFPGERPASTGRLLQEALASSGIPVFGAWPPETVSAGLLREHTISCVIGLPQHVLALTLLAQKWPLTSVLLCSDFAPQALQKRIRENSGAEIFVHYGSTEMGLLGAVDCEAHCGGHLLSSDLLVEICDPDSGLRLPSGERGEIVVSTLRREAMPLLRYRTGDFGILDCEPCLCGGQSPRLYAVHRGHDQDITRRLDEQIFSFPVVLDYQAVLRRHGGEDCLEITLLSLEKNPFWAQKIQDHLAFWLTLETELPRRLTVQMVTKFTASHTAKRLLSDQRRAYASDS